ncbi:hypothetical protein EYV94_18575 [Puteibacter caeruleilacunae]|nr:hypothetical protein EYV94_18575 [Puteibacter caeruleilacunae]
MLKGILAISGQGGLFKLVSEAKNTIIVESLVTGKRMPAYASARISALEDIALYTYDEELPLKDVFKKIADNTEGGEAISHKSSNNELKAFFEEAIPEYDEDRVYVSDMKKIVQWYNVLHKAELLNFEEEVVEEEKTEE